MALFAEIAAAAVMIGLVFCGGSIGKELRPSQHGLAFQNSSPARVNSSSDMRSFFNVSSASNSSDMMTMPKAVNSSSDSSPSSWWRSTAGDGGGGRNRVREALVVASLVCGVTGGVLLVATGLIYLSKHRKHKANESRADKNNDKLQLVVSNP